MCSVYFSDLKMFTSCTEGLWIVGGPPWFFFLKAKSGPEEKKMKHHVKLHVSGVSQKLFPINSTFFKHY